MSGPRRRAPALAALARLAPAALLACGAPTAPRPNLLLLSVDTLRADRLACYGGPADVGRGICALAASGTRFTWAFAAAPSTAPSVASMLSSRYPSEHGVRQSPYFYMGDEHVLLAEVLAEAGYDTAAFVSNPVLGSFRNFDQGFGVYDARMTRVERNRPGQREREAERASDDALAWLQTRARAPWFLWVHYQDPHGPYEPPGAPPERDEPGERRLPLLESETGHRGIPAYQRLPELFTAAAYERRYLAEIRYLDRHVSRLVARSDALGDPPAVLLTADHGEAFGEDEFYFCHGHSLGVEQIRVPLLWRPPVPQPPVVVDEPMSLLDVAPTLLSLAGLEVPEAYRGRPLPLEGLATAPGSGPRPVFAELVAPASRVNQAAIVLAGGYFARARDTSPASQRLVAELGLPRAARLAADGSVSPYLPARSGDPQGALPALLDAFLTGVAPHPGHRQASVPSEVIDQMRALGYVGP